MKKKIVIITIFLLCLILCLFLVIKLNHPKETSSEETGESGVEDVVGEEDEVIVEDEVDMSGLEYDEQDTSENETEQSTNSSDSEKANQTDDTKNTENTESTDNQEGTENAGDAEGTESTEKDTIPDKQRYDKDGDGFVDGWY